MNENGRYELKFLLDQNTLTDARHWLINVCGARKKHTGRSVNSLYFDSSDYDSLRENLAGIANRKKTRLRWYDYKEDFTADEVILEQKIRNGRLGSKILLPVPVTKEEIRKTCVSKIVDLVRSRIPVEHAISIFRDYLHPTVCVSYYREYYENFCGMRITLDSSIVFYNGSSGDYLERFFAASYPKTIMEIKFAPELKDKVAQLLRFTHFVPKRHSKYVIGLSIFHQATYL